MLQWDRFFKPPTDGPPMTMFVTPNEARRLLGRMPTQPNTTMITGVLSRLAHLSIKVEGEEEPLIRLWWDYFIAFRDYLHGRGLLTSNETASQFATSEKAKALEVAGAKALADYLGSKTLWKPSDLGKLLQVDASAIIRWAGVGGFELTPGGFVRLGPGLPDFLTWKYPGK